MIDSITLKNFKLHTLTKVEPALLTIFIGPNNSGKTSIFHGLMALHQAILRGNASPLLETTQRLGTNPENQFLYPPTREIDLGSFTDVVHTGEKELGIEISGHLEDSDPKYGGPKDLKLALGYRDNQLAHHEGNLKFEIRSEAGRRELKWSWARDFGPQQFQFNFGAFGKVFNFSVGADPFTIQPAGISGPVVIESGLAAELSSFANQIARTPASLIQSVHSVYPLRGLEESGYPITPGPEDNIYRMMLADRTLALLSILAYRNDVLDRVSRWLEDLIQVRIRTMLVPPRRVTIVCEPTGEKSAKGLFSNQGTGAGQLPFILVPIALMPHGSTAIISEPEAHLHPKAQTQIASLFVEIALKEKKQFIIETHSEHLLHSMLHAVARGTIKKEELAIYFFAPHDGSVEVRRVEVDARGRVEGGLPGFFDHSLNELSSYLDALKES